MGFLKLAETYIVIGCVSQMKMETGSMSCLLEQAFLFSQSTEDQRRDMLHLKTEKLFYDFKQVDWQEEMYNLMCNSKDEITYTHS